MRRIPVVLCTTTLLAFVLLFGHDPVAGSGPDVIINVTHTDDPNPNGCSAEHCTIREALIHAGELPGMESVLLGATDYQLELGELLLDSDVHFEGEGTITAAPNSRILHITEGASVEILGLTLSGGHPQTEEFECGGGIFNEGAAIIVNVTVEDSTATIGGGICNYGTTVLSHILLSGNTAELDGGGLANYGDAQMDLSTVRSNHATNGGGLYNSMFLSVETSLIEDNRVSDNEFRASLGGGLYNHAHLSVARTVIRGNEASCSECAAGAGIYNAGGATFLQSTIDSNVALHGAGITNTNELVLDRSTVSRNRYNAITNFEIGTIEIVNSTISSNLAGTSRPEQAGVGGIVSFGTVSIESSTIADNGRTLDDAGGLQQWSLRPVTIRNSILVRNGLNCQVQFSASAGNNVADDSSCGEPVMPIVTDRWGVDPLLMPLADNGGVTETHALQPDSPAIDFGADCPDRDQRGFPRPALLACDSGSYESPNRQIIWADHDCSNSANPVDALLTLIYDAGLGSVASRCAMFGEFFTVNGSSRKWGDIDCSSTIDSIDALKILRSDAGLPVMQPAACPPIGESILLTFP